MDMFIKVGVLVLFAIVMVGIGLYCRKKVVDVNGFVLGGRNVGPWLTAFSYGTSYFSAVVFVGYAGQFGWKYGVAATWAGIANALLGSYMAWAILGRRTRVMTQWLNSATMPQFFEVRFQSKLLKLLSSAIIFIFLIPYTASLYNGLSRLFEMAFHVDYSICVIAMAVLTAIYVIAGGYMAAALNDFIQGIIMLVGIIAVVIGVLHKNGGFQAALDGLGRVTDLSVSSTPGVFASFFGPAPLDLLGVMLLTSLGTWGLPQMVQKFYAIRNEHSIRKGMIISTLFAAIVAGGCYFLGGFGRLFSSRINVMKDGYDAIIPTMLSSLPVVLIAVVIILVLSASMSTLSSLVLTSSSTLTLDFLSGLRKMPFEEKGKILLMRCFIAVFILISAAIAILQFRSGNSFIAQMMGISWGALAGAFLAPFLYGLYWKRVTVLACAGNFLFASLFMLANIFWRPSFPALLRSPINAGAFCMLAGLVIVPLLSLLSRKPDEEYVERVFSCYDRTVSVPIKDSMTLEEEK